MSEIERELMNNRDRIEAVRGMVQSQGWAIVAQYMTAMRDDFLRELLLSDAKLMDKYANEGGRDYVRAAVAAIETLLDVPDRIVQDYVGSLEKAGIIGGENDE